MTAATEFGVQTEFIDPEPRGLVEVVASDDHSVLVQVVKRDGETYSCLVYARYEWARVDGTRRQFMYEARRGADRYAISTWSEAIAYARSLTRGPGGL